MAYNGENVVTTLAFIFDLTFILAGKEDNHRISDKLDFGPDQTFHF